MNPVYTLNVPNRTFTRERVVPTISAMISWESTSIVITAGLAEIAAGSYRDGLGGYLAARSDAEHYASKRREVDPRLGPFLQRAYHRGRGRGTDAV